MHQGTLKTMKVFCEHATCHLLLSFAIFFLFAQRFNSFLLFQRCFLEFGSTNHVFLIVYWRHKSIDKWHRFQIVKAEKTCPRISQILDDLFFLGIIVHWNWHNLDSHFGLVDSIWKLTIFLIGKSTHNMIRR